MSSKQQHVIRKQGYNYLLYIPPDYGVGKKWPLILFLHGAGEKGNNMNLLKRTALPKMLEEISQFPFVVVSPQCSRGLSWSAELVIELLDEVIGRYKIDEDRIYLTGISMGGDAAWDAGCLRPWRFAAVAPICGAGDPDCADRLKNVPVWAFHGAMDEIAPVGGTLAMVGALKKAGGDVRLTVYADAGHDSWTRAYSNPDLYAWFLSHCRKNGHECPEAAVKLG